MISEDSDDRDDTPGGGVRLLLDRDFVRAGLVPSSLEAEGLAIGFSERLSADPWFIAVLIGVGWGLFETVTKQPASRAIDRLLDFVRSRDRKLKLECQAHQLDSRVEMLLGSLEAGSRQELDAAMRELPILKDQVNRIIAQAEDPIRQLYCVWQDDHWELTYYISVSGDIVEFPLSSQSIKKCTILFLSANPAETDRLALDREARAIQVELERSGFRERFEFATRWAAEPLDLLRELRKLKPTVVHFSGHGGPEVIGEHWPGQASHRDVKPGHDRREARHGLFFQGADGRAQFVSAQAIEQTFGVVGGSVKVVVLGSACSEAQAEALLAHVDCVVGMSGSIDDSAARSFAIGFYGGLGERESVAAAYKQGCAAISLEGLPDGDRPQLRVRAGVDATKLVLAADYP